MGSGQGSSPTTASALAEALRLCAHEYIRAYEIPKTGWFESTGSKVVLFRPLKGRHGNFIDASYSVISDRHSRRLEKRHAQRSALPAQFRNTAMELDSSNSSDALLMNIFCHPRVDNAALRDVLGLRQWHHPQFGVRHQVKGEGAPGSRHLDPRTELDVVFCNELHAESKLTEADFTAADATKLGRYTDVWKVFDKDALPRSKGQFDGYQLIRNVLAAEERGTRFVVIHDERRPDLLERWTCVRAAIKPKALRERCGAVTWQQIARACPSDLRAFLSVKYGIS